MKKNANIIATGVLIAGLMAPSTMLAGEFLNTIANWFGASFGATLGHRAANSVASEVNDMLPRRARQMLIVAAAVGVVGYLIYEYKKDSDTNTSRKNQRARSCGKKGCSHKGCK